MGRVAKVLQRLECHAQSAWYLPLIAFLSALDAYVIFVPNEALLIPAVLARRRHWLRATLWVTLGSAIGATSFAWLTHVYGESMIRWAFPKLIDSHEWQSSVRAIQNNGLWGLALVSFSPLPQHAAVAIAGLARMRLSHVFFAVLIGRAVKYVGVGWLTFHSPKLLQRFGLLPKDWDGSADACHPRPSSTQDSADPARVEPLRSVPR